MLETIPNEKLGCRYTGFAKKCRDIVLAGECACWVNMRGTNTNTGEAIDKWGCVDSFQHLLLHEVASEARNGAKETESFRNAVLSSRPAQVPSVETNATILIEANP